VEASAIKLPTALKLARLHATTVVWRVTCRAIVRWKPRPSLATSVVRKVTSRVTAPRVAPPVVPVLAVAGPPQVRALARNATAVVKSGTSLARVLKLLPTLGMVAEATAVVLAVEVKLATPVAA